MVSIYYSGIPIFYALASGLQAARGSVLTVTQCPSITTWHLVFPIGCTCLGIKFSVPSTFPGIVWLNPLI